MGKRANRFLAMLMSAVLVVGNIPAYAADGDETVRLQTEAAEEADFAGDEEETDPCYAEEAAADWYTKYDYEKDEEAGKIWLTASKGELSGDITVPAKATIDGKEYAVGVKPSGTSIWSADGDKITGISFEKGVEAFNYLDSLFYGLSKLKKADLSGLDTSNVTSMRFLFQGCYELEEVNLEGVKTGKVQEMDFMFFMCWKLKSLDLSGFDTSSLIKLNAVFSGCKSLESLDVSSFDTSNVTWMDSLFSGCSSLKSLDISNFSSGKCESMYSLFYGCESLETLNLGELDTANVKNMGDMFKGCSKLTGIDLHSFRTTRLEDMRSMFQGCTALKQADLRSFDLTKLNEAHTEYLDPALYFLTNSGVEELYLPKKAMSSHDFSEYSALKKVGYVGTQEEWNALNNTLASGVTLTCNVPAPQPDVDPAEWYKDYYFTLDGEEILIHASNGKITDGNVIIPATALVEGKEYRTVLDSANNYDDPAKVFDNESLWKMDKGTVTGITIQKGVKATHNLNGLFAGLENLSSVDMSGLDTSAVTSMTFLFRGCYKINEIKLGNPDTSAVTEMRGMFAGCIELQRLDVSGLDTQNVTNMIGMFDFLSAVKTLDLRNFDTSSVTDMTSMFDNCKSLESVDLSSFNTSKVEVMISMFSDCESLKELDLSSFDTSSVRGFQWMFENCRSLQSLDLRSFSTKSAQDIHQMFSGSSALESILFGEGFTTEHVTDMYGVFENCRSLKNVDVSRFHTENVTSMLSLFAFCENLSSVDVSNFHTTKVTNFIGMFKKCLCLRSLDLRSVDFTDEKTLSELTADSGVTHLYLGQYAMSGYDFTSGYTDGKFAISNIYFTGTEEEWAAKNNSYPDSVTVSCNFSGDPVELEKVVESVSLNHSSVTIEQNGSVQISATVYPEDATDKRVFWEVVGGSADISVDQTGKVTATNVRGTFRIKATAMDRGLVSAVCEVTVKDKGSDDPTPAPAIPIPGSGEARDSQPLIEEGETLYLVKGQSFTLAKGWSSKDKILSVSKTGVVKAKNTGTATLVYGENEKTIHVSITAPTITSKIPSLPVGTSQEIALNCDSNLPVLWYSAAPNIATVDQGGHVTGLSKGTAKVTAMINGKAYTCSVKVTEEKSLPERDLYLNVKSSKNVKIKGLKKTVWTISGNEAEGKEILKVSGSKFKGLKAGDVKLVCEGYVLNVHVEDPALEGSAKPCKMTLNMKAGEVSEKPVTLLGVEQDVIYKSNKPSVAYIDDSGLIRARSKGTAKITAKINGKTVTITVKVK
ncbi:MAG: BspA family leucine-rich repeat surface protein [Lachnospiraceae bacterium]|nr:BspA family leucine-rich repeat surface protein [Lachnospiraceae bacterium]